MTNANALFNTIDFDIVGPPGFVHTIQLTSPLPTITARVSMNATTQPGYVGTPLVQLDGSATASGGLVINGGGTTIRGLAIMNFPGDGLQLNGGDAVIEANHIGTNAAGTDAQPNDVGILVASGGNTIGGPDPSQGNVISGNSGTGMESLAATTTPLKAT